MTQADPNQLLREAELVADAEEVQACLDRIGSEIADRLAAACPLVMPVMGGAVVFAGQLLPRLRFPLEFDYLHVTRYRGKTRGEALEWVVMPRQPVHGRTVLVLDDILDEGETLAAIRDKLVDMGAREVYCAVLADKDNGLDKPIRADFVGLTVPDRFVFGCGMDVYGWWRNLPAIYALRA